jgi:hypothetical protein
VLIYRIVIIAISNLVKVLWGQKMVGTIKTYTSIEDLAESIDEELSNTKSNLGEYLRELDKIRVLAEKSKKIRETVLKLAGKKAGSFESSDEIAVGNMKVILEDNPTSQLEIIESAVRSHQERLIELQKARDGLKSFDQLGDTDGLNFMVLEDQKVPERILLRTS